jgi:hypothetical protein
VGELVPAVDGLVAMSSDGAEFGSVVMSSVTSQPIRYDVSYLWPCLTLMWQSRTLASKLYRGG